MLYCIRYFTGHKQCSVYISHKQVYCHSNVRIIGIGSNRDRRERIFIKCSKSLFGYLRDRRLSLVKILILTI